MTVTSGIRSSLHEHLAGEQFYANDARKFGRPRVKELKAPSDGSFEACARLSREKILEIKNNPSRYYVNVHNRPFPNGALRGQLSPSGM
jgi:CHRD domain